MSQKTMTIIGWALSGLYGLFILGASVYPKLAGLPVADETMVALGWEASPILLIGMIELVCVVLYLFPVTSVLGAVLLMAVLGGAMATQIRAGTPLFSNVLFSIYLGLFMWGGLWLRSPALRALFPFARRT
ncbi:DoxX family protein [Maritimibacter sp. DP1N21-5]|uniref:DoxX family protein n=1 Tax=Maritimibacter sp. DP1N21-5 TaxID=2836867 RepID=UPI001C44DA14|nr:DoxX family protein [Maritimibacter sp. DP1N21-5]MBV7408640.1 DoxX family protein [Maritimibacter sp. DP1N21-5]